MSGANTPERDAQLLSVGHQCSLPSCQLVDFLPFKCHHCSEQFCAEHYSVEGHNCSKYDERKFNRVAPSCPLCNEPVAIRLGQDPNIQMEHHISTECSVMTGKSKTKSAPVCAHTRCRKVLFAPIRCDKCKRQFCPTHRFPADHTCAATATNPSGVTSKPKPQIISTSTTAAISTKASAASAKASATMGAIKKAVTSTGQSLTSSSSPVAADTSKASSNPFSKTDRSPSRPSAASLPPSPTITTISIPKPERAFDPMIRAKQEHQSRLRAMHERAKKGLLSEEEKVILAEEEARRSKGIGRSGDKDCAIM